MDKANKMLEVLESVRSKLHFVALVLSLLFIQSVFLSAVVLAQESAEDPALFNANELFKESQDMPCAQTGDCSGNIASLDQNRATATLLRGGGYLAGAEMFEGASERVDEKGLSPNIRYGLIHVTESSIVAMFNLQPGVDLPKFLASQWLPGAGHSSTLAQGRSDGMTFLRGTGLEAVWEMMRNIAYAGFVIVIIASGFMIMFRSKIGGQISVNIMNTIPRIVLGLILVTFSFAIAGFILDIGRLMTVVVASYMKTSLPGFNIVELGGPLQMTGRAFSDMSLQTIAPLATGGLISGSGGNAVFGGVNAALLSLLPLQVVTGIIALIGAIIILCIAVFAGFRVFFTLVTLYIKIILDLILGPLYILIGSLPGKESAIVQWAKRLLAASISYPFVLFILNVVRYVGFPPASSAGVHATSIITFMNGMPPDPASGLSLGVFITIAGYFIAAGSPAIVTDMLQVEENKGVQAALQDAQKSASKIPLVGGIVA